MPEDLLLILVSLVIVSALWSSYREYSSGTKPYRLRPCHGRAWKAVFPAASKQRTRDYLTCFTEAMGFSPQIKLKFHPSDRVIDVYRSLYFGRIPLGDQMECETFLENVSSRFAVDEQCLTRCWHEQITLGELYRWVCLAQNGEVVSHHGHLSH